MLCNMKFSSLINRQPKVPLTKRCATWDGADACSAVMMRFRFHKLPGIQEQIEQAAVGLFERIRHEKLSEMHFLKSSEHIALHFKIDPNGVLHFIYASIIEDPELHEQMEGWTKIYLNIENETVNMFENLNIFLNYL